MYALRPSRLVVLFGLFALTLVSFTASSAVAGGGRSCHSGSYGGSSFCHYTPSYCNYSSSYCNYTPSYCSYPSYDYCNYTPSYCNYTPSCYNYTSCYTPVVSYCAKPIYVPITTYDCYGRPSIVWQVSYANSPTFVQ